MNNFTNIAKLFVVSGLLSIVAISEVIAQPAPNEQTIQQITELKAQIESAFSPTSSHLTSACSRIRLRKSK